MKHANLTTQEKIISWFERYPFTINQYCENNTHILDWVFNGYRGKESAKISLVYELIKRDCSVDYCSFDTFKIITNNIFKIEQPANTNIILLNIQKSKHLQRLKDDCVFFNNLLDNTLFKEQNEELKYDILSRNQPQYNKQEQACFGSKIAYNSHPFIFLIQSSILYSHNFFKIEKNLKLLNKLNTFSEINLSNTPFEYLENSSDISSYIDKLKLDKLDNCFDVTKKLINSFKQVHSGENELNKLHLLLEETEKIEFYKILKKELSSKNNFSKKIKI